ncbi:PHB depolymerase family esterase [Actibacterium sp.]|uniref:alpha/beta hydrolase family esterase n=1 Tax=Actibacterium sp. TaxID=1872125 RepID=UPI0035657A7C
MSKLTSITAAIGLAVVLSVSGCQTATSGPIRDAIKARRDAKSDVVSVAPGLDLYSIVHGGITRTFYVHVPDNFDSSANKGAVFAFHGGQGTGDKTAATSGLPAAADQMGFVAVFPNAGDGRQWNDGRETTTSKIDDVGFVHAIINLLEDDLGVNRNHIFATGISNGGMMVQRLACDDTRDFAAFAVIAANMPSNLLPVCKPSRAAPIMFFNGTTDPLMPFDGGVIKSSKLLGAGAGGNVVSNAETIAFWTSVNHCGGESKTSLPDRVNDGTTVVQRTFSCSGSEVISYLIANGGHTWPGADQREMRVTGKITKDLSATPTMLSFFRRYGL